MIKNSEEANKYYKLINEYIDEYLNTWKINPINLGKYLKKDRIKSFIERKGLSELSNIDIIINDVIQDRVSLEKETVKKFESFDFDKAKDDGIKSILYKNIGKCNIEHEKKVSDHFDVSLSEVDIIDSDLHKFKVGEVISFVYLDSEIETIKENIRMYLLSKIEEKNLTISIGSEFSINLGKIIDGEILSSKLEDFAQENFLNVMSNILNCDSTFNEYFIGIVKK
jgi:hypothetical protein